MSLEFTYDGAPFTVDVKPSTVSIPTRAEMGDTGNGLIPVEDMAGSIEIVGHQPFIVEESDCAQPRLFTGWVVERDYARQPEGGLIVEASRLSDINIVDGNAAAGFRIIWDTDGDRPEETWNDRLAWIVGSDYLGPLIGGDTTFFGSYTQTMDPADYRGSTPGSVLEDLCERTGGVLNWFIFWNPDTSNLELFIKREQYTTGLSTLSISNVEDDVDGVTVFAPDQVAKLAREPDQTYSEVIVEFGDGQKLYRSLATTAATYIQRGTTISRPYTKRASTAIAQADQWLVAHSAERDRITCVMRSVPAASVGLVRAGMGIMFRASHLPGYEAEGGVEMRIVMCSPVPVSDVGGAVYDIALELIGAMPEPPEPGLSATLLQHNNQTWTYFGDGQFIVGFYATGDDPQGGFYPEPLEGALEYMPFDYGNIQYNGIRATADGTVNVNFVGGFLGVSNGSASHTVTLRQNGTIIATETQTDSRPPGLYSYSGVFDISASDVAALTDDEFQVGYSFSAVGCGMCRLSTQPGDTNVQTHFRVTGTSVPLITGGDATGTTEPGTVTSTDDPTADDDAADGYTFGTIWINTATGESFILVDPTEGRAIWMSTTGSAWKNPVRVATTGAGTLISSFENGDTIDGVTLATGDRILIKDQATEQENGIYIVAASGVPARASDMDASTEFAGATVYVLLGTVNAGTLWRCTNTTAPEVNIDEIAFTRVTGGPGVPALVYSTTNAAGSAATFVATDATLAIFDTTLPTANTAGNDAATGSAAFAARRDHVHATPLYATEVLVADGTSGNGDNVSSYVEMTTPDTTTSATLEDITGATTTITLQTTSHIAVWMSCHVSADAVCDYGIAVNIDGTDHDEVVTHLTSVDEGGVIVVHRTATALPPGTYTVKGRHRRIAGGGTPETDRADLLVMAMGHEGPIMLTTEAQDDFLYSDG